LGTYFVAADLFARGERQRLNRGSSNGLKRSIAYCNLA
jgi:hypothetical protein